MNATRQNNDTLDVCKFVLAMMVVAIHSQVCLEIGGYNLLWPWLRMAVPLFFMISAYFLFKKIGCNPRNSGAVIKKYVLRNVKLYLFWLIVLSPMVVWIRWSSWMRDGLIWAPLKVARSVFFGSTFTGSWFIAASVVGSVIIVALSRRFGSKVLLAITVLVYLLVCVRSSYYPFVVGHLGQGRIAVSIYERIFTAGYNSFPAALVWIAFGKLAAESRGLSRRVCIVGAFLGAFCLLAEWLVVGRLTGEWRNDCYFSLLLLCPFVFCLLLAINVRCSCARFLRNVSIIMFCSHGFLLRLMARVGKICGLEGTANAACSFCLTVLCCMLVTRMFAQLEDKRGFSVLRFAH